MNAKADSAATSEANSKGYIPLRWWREERDNVHGAIDALVETLRDAQRARRSMYQSFAEFYGGQELAGLGLTTYDVVATQYVPPSLPHNVVRNMIETVVARIAKERPLPQVTTARGNYRQRKKGRKLTTAIEGTFDSAKVFTKTKRCARDAATFGTGVVKVYRDDDDVCIERVFPWELLVDIADGREGEPRCITQLKWYDKAVLCEKARAWNPEATTEEIDAIEHDIYAAQVDGDDLEGAALGSEGRDDRVLVRESWHLRSSKRATDGKHAITINGRTLLFEDYERDYFPFAVLTYKDPLAGFWGEGLACEAAGYQVEINMVSEMIRSAHYAHPMGVWLVPNNSGTLDTDYGNDELCVIKHTPGFPPQHIAPNPLHPQQYQYLADLRRDAMGDSGVSQMSAMSQKPAGIIAAKALNSLDDNESQRFALFSANWSSFHVEIAKRVVDLYSDIAEEHSDYSLRAKKRGGFVDMKWSDISLSSDDYVMQTFPASMLGNTPSAKLQNVYDLFDRGVIDATRFLQLLDAPDLEADTDLETAATMLVDEQIEFMLDADDPKAPDVFQSPEPFMNLKYALSRAQQHYCLEKIHGTPPEYLALLQDYMRATKKLLDDQAASAAPPPANMNANPMGAPPVNDGMAPPPGGDPSMMGGAPPPPAPPPPPMPAMPMAGGMQ